MLWHDRRRWAALFLFAAALIAPAAADDSPSEPGLVQLTHDGDFKQRPAWSPDGTLLSFARHTGSTIFLHVLDVNAKQERRLTDRKDPEYDAVFSPDGQRVAFAIDNASPNQGDIDVYTSKVSGQDLQPVAKTEGKLSHEEWPSWSPDGRWIAFTSTRQGNQELYVSLPDGKEPKRLTSDPALDAHPSWSPDGKRIAFSTNRWGDLELALINSEGGQVTRLTTSRGLDDYPAWSPDGRHLAFTSNRDGNFEIYVTDADGRELTNASDNPSIDNFPAWTPDGKLTFVSNRDGGFEVYVSTRPMTGSAAR